MSDIDLGNQEDGVFIRIVDDGAAYNLFADMSNSQSMDPDKLEEMIILGLAKDVNYDRVLDLNHITMTVAYPESD